jgi:hypothetical protein
MPLHFPWDVQTLLKKDVTDVCFVGLYFINIIRRMPSSGVWHRSSSVHTGSRRRHFPEDGILHFHRRGNLKPYISIICSMNVPWKMENHFLSLICLIIISLLTPNRKACKRLDSRGPWIQGPRMREKSSRKSDMKFLCRWGVSIFMKYKNKNI